MLRKPNNFALIVEMLHDFSFVTMVGCENVTQPKLLLVNMAGYQNITLTKQYF